MSVSQHKNIRLAKIWDKQVETNKEQRRMVLRKAYADAYEICKDLEILGYNTRAAEKLMFWLEQCLKEEGK